ncbi:ABC transporter substrate-binding protein [Chloroflexota bacterium]
MYQVLRLLEATGGRPVCSSTEDWLPCNGSTYKNQKEVNELKRIAFLIIATLLVLGLILLGCGGTPSEQQEEEEEPEPTILLIALADLLGNDVLDPILNVGANTQKMLGGVYDSLVMVQTDGTFGPGLAESWDHNEDYTVWTIHLREGVQFHDGWGEMTADDVKFSLERFLSEESLTSGSIMIRPLIEDIVVLDTYTVEIHTASILDFVEQQLVGDFTHAEGIVMSKAYFEAEGQEGFLTHPIGTGPWKFVEHVPGDRVVLEAADEHWSGLVASFDQLVLMEIPEETARVAMLKTGDADLIDISIDRATELGDEGFDLGQIMAADASLQFWGTWRPEAIDANMPTTHQEVREALSLAIDRQAIIDSIFDGRADMANIPGNTGPVSPEFDTEPWREWALELNRYDPARAIELLEEAGFADGFEITYYSYTGIRAPWAHQLAEIIASYWEDIGVQTNITPVEWTWFRAARNAEPQAPELTGTVSMTALGIYTFSVWQTARTYSPRPHTTWDMFDPEDEEWNTLCENTRETMDEEQRLEYFYELLEQAGESYVTPPLFYTPQVYAVSDKVDDWLTIELLPTPSLWTPYFTPAE